MSEQDKAISDMITFGSGFMKDGKRIDPREVVAMDEWEEQDSGHLKNGDLWIFEVNHTWILSEQDPTAWDGFRDIGEFTCVEEAKKVGDSYG